MKTLKSLSTISVFFILCTILLSSCKSYHLKQSVKNYPNLFTDSVEIILNPIYRDSFIYKDSIQFVNNGVITKIKFKDSLIYINQEIPPDTNKIRIVNYNLDVISKLKKKIVKLEKQIIKKDLKIAKKSGKSLTLIFIVLACFGFLGLYISFRLFT